jgi:RNA polymerase sigma-70 factor, ECF subfamily
MLARDECPSAVAVESGIGALPAAGARLLPNPMQAPDEGASPAEPIHQSNNPPIQVNTPDGQAPAAESVQTLTRAIRRGDAEAFSRFCDLYSFRLYKFLLVLARDESQAQEVLQTVLIKLAKRFQVFDEERQLWAWLCRVAKNAFIDHRRARRRDDRFLPLDDLAEEPDGEQRTPSQLSEILREILPALPPEERELLQAAYVDGRPLGELAEASGQTYKAVQCRLARLRHKLKEQLLNHLRHEHQS